MPFWFPVIAAGAAAALVGKALIRHFNGELAQSAVYDPKGVRTIARFESEAPESVLVAVAREVERRVEGDIGVTVDAVSDGRVDVVRLAACGAGYTLTLTRAWTGPQLDARAVELLERLHAVLAAHPGVRDLAWHARQDRELVEGFPYPFDP